MSEHNKWPGYYYLFLSAFGISNLGSWIYLIALNVFVWRMTESPAAVAGLYIVGPVVRIVCNFFIGSLIDRLNKKRLVIWSNVARAVFVFCMPFSSSLFVVYTLVACTNVAGTIFGPSNTFLLSTLVHNEHRLRFNSLNSTFSSGAFMIGPALGGLILASTSIAVAMWINAGAFLVAALLLAFIPNAKEVKVASVKQSIAKTLKADYIAVFEFSKLKPLFTKFIIIYSAALMIAYALDSQEMTFLLGTLNISEGLYGVTVGLTGIGAIVGGLVATAYARKIHVFSYIKVGFTLTLFCYFVFYLAPVYSIALVSFILLGFFMAFSNSGYATVYQEKVPAELMGRYSGMVNLGQSIVQVALTLVIGVLADVFTVQLITVLFAGIGVLLSLLIWTLKKEMFDVQS